MTTRPDNRPIIIKRRKVVAASAHHGGAWKVAYADFVTAMMAFFLLMWLLNATTENQRKGLADYFNPTIAVNRISGGGNDVLNGETVYSQNVLSRKGTGATDTLPTANDKEADPVSASEDDMKRMEVASNGLLGRGGESMLDVNDQRHVDIRLTDEGLILEIFDLPEAPLFDAQHRGTPLLGRILNAVSFVARDIDGPVALEAHVAAVPAIRVGDQAWNGSEARSRVLRRGMLDGGLQAARIQRTTAHADREPVSANPLSVRNNRVEIVFLRE